MDPRLDKPSPPHLIKMLVTSLLLLGVLTAAHCNKPCLDQCLPHHSENHCFSRCDCLASHHFPTHILTEDGRRFTVAQVPPKPRNLDDDDGYVFLGCKVECADLCFRFAVGSAQLHCVTEHCGCGSLVTEVVPPPPVPTPAPAPQTPTSPMTSGERTVKLPFTDESGRSYEITPSVSDRDFFKDCAACVDTCARLKTMQLLERCLTFCSCATSVVEVPRQSF